MKTTNQQSVNCNSSLAWGALRFEFAKKWWKDKNNYGYGSFNDELYKRILSAKFSKLVKE